MNDNAPTFDKDAYLAYVLEDMADETLVILTVEDADTLENGVGPGTAWSLLQSPGSEYFKLEQLLSNPAQAIIGTTGIDREDYEEIILTVTVTDTGSPALSTSVLIIIRVDATNNRSPYFTEVVFTGEIYEGVTTNTAILTVSALDRDNSGTVELIYSITGVDAQFFVINSTTGELTSDALFDREEKEWYNFQVTVHDGGTDSLSATTDVVVQILVSYTRVIEQQGRE